LPACALFFRCSGKEAKVLRKLFLIQPLEDLHLTSSLPGHVLCMHNTQCLCNRSHSSNLRVCDLYVFMQCMCVCVHAVCVCVCVCVTHALQVSQGKPTHHWLTPCSP